MKIVHFGQKNCMSREGGVEVVVGEIAKRQVTLGHDVTCINRGNKHIAGEKYNIKKVNMWEGVHVKYAPTIDAKGLSAVSSSFFASVMSVIGNYDVVHIHAEGPCYFSFIPKLFGKKVICHVHGLDWQRSKWRNSFASKFIYAGEGHLIKNADSIIVLSEALKKYFLSEYKIETNFIPNGVERNNIIETNIIFKKYNLIKNSYILYLSRLVPEKRCDLLIDAYKSIKTDKKLVIAGASSDTDEYVKYLKEKSINNKNIIFTGYVEGQELKELYSNSYIYVLPSDIEGMPLSLLEAMSYGNYCLTSDIDECAEVIEKYGMCFKKGDVIDLQNKLIFLLKNEHIVIENKKQIIEFVTKKYSWDKTVKKIMELYNK